MGRPCRPEREHTLHLGAHLLQAEVSRTLKRQLPIEVEAQHRQTENTLLRTQGWGLTAIDVGHGNGRKCLAHYVFNARANGLAHAAVRTAEKHQQRTGGRLLAPMLLVQNALHRNAPVCAAARNFQCAAVLEKSWITATPARISPMPRTAGASRLCRNSR